MSKSHRSHGHRIVDWRDPRLERLIASALDGAEILKITALKSDTTEATVTAKDTGYGAPLRIDVRHEGALKSVVLHSATPNPFGHEYRANRAEEMLIAADTFGLVPRHTRVFDVGAFRDDDFVSLRGTGEFYLLTEYAEGRPYAHDLRKIAELGALRPEDLQRVDALVHYLVSTHSIKLPDASLYTRSIRDLVGSGEGIFGIVDGYPPHADGTSREQLDLIESLCLSWRSRLKHRYPRLVRIHGDFHPFNVLFDERSELRLLDASRGCAGDAADDVTAMAVNFLFFALDRPASWQAAFQPLWRRFWAEYLQHSRDGALLEVVAPFLAWRCLVLANPVWYPHVPRTARMKLLNFVTRALRAKTFDPESASEIFATTS
ncbi:MAG TPA: phosphotransferase [Polyangiaceae bacterium]|nr:phosphotransferase [Polyangiaceae bacterium]